MARTHCQLATRTCHTPNSAIHANYWQRGVLAAGIALWAAGLICGGKVVCFAEAEKRSALDFGLLLLDKKELGAPCREGAYHLQGTVSSLARLLPACVLGPVNCFPCTLRTFFPIQRIIRKLPCQGFLPFFYAGKPTHSTPRRSRAIFPRPNFKKWSEHGVFFYILIWKYVSCDSGVQILISHLTGGSARTRRFSEATFRPSRPINPWTNAIFGDFPNMSRTCMFFLWVFLFLSSTLVFSCSLLCFSSRHIFGMNSKTSVDYILITHYRLETCSGACAPKAVREVKTVWSWKCYRKGLSGSCKF